MAAVCLVAAAHLWVRSSNPPGFHQDEAAVALNAATVADTGRDEHGALLPLFFRSYGDYKSPEYVYLLAGVFRVTGPGQVTARALSAVLELAAIAALALLALRRSSSARAGVAMFVLAGTTAWLYELGRLAWEVTLEPLLVVALLLLLERSHREGRWSPARGVAVGLVLAAITYSYAAGRLYGPLVAVCIPLVSGLRRQRFLAAAWGTFLVALFPLLAFVLRHPGALTARLEETSFVEDGMSAAEIVRRGVENYLGYLDLPHWVTKGDPTIVHHVPGAGSVPLVVAVLGVAGLVLLLVRSQLDGFWRFALAAALLGPVPAALTTAPFHSFRSLPFLLGLLVFSIPALALLDRGLAERRRWAVPAVAVLALAWLAWSAQFVRTFEARGPDRRFDSSVPGFIATALARAPRVYVQYGDDVARTHARWYQEVNHIPRERLVVLGRRGHAPAGAYVFGAEGGCAQPCTMIGVVGSNWLARTA